MKRLLIIITVLLIHIGVFAQIDANSLMGLIHATTAEMTAIVSPIEGSLIYNTTDYAIYQYNGVSWGIVGQTGPVGPQGPQGIQGIPGDPATDDQTLATDGTSGNVSITGGNGISLNVNDADSDPTNEIQNLSLAGNDLTISSGNTVTLTPLIDINLGKDDLIQDPESRTYDMNAQDLGFINGNVGIGNTTPNSILQISGSVSAPIRSTAINTSLGPNDFTLITTEKDLIITLPAANTCQGRLYLIKNFGGGDNNTNVLYIKNNGDLDDKIDNDNLTWLQSDGVNWHQINKF